VSAWAEAKPPTTKTQRTNRQAIDRLTATRILTYGTCVDLRTVMLKNLVW